MPVLDQFHEVQQLLSLFFPESPVGRYMQLGWLCILSIVFRLIPSEEGMTDLSLSSNEDYLKKGDGCRRGEIRQVSDYLKYNSETSEFLRTEDIPQD